MGIAVALVLFAYLLIGGAIFAVVAAVMVARKHSGKKISLTLAGIAFTLAWPVWFYFGNKAMFYVSCSIGNPGAHIYESVRVDALSHSGGGDFAPQWPLGNEFLRDCGKECFSKLNDTYSVFSYYKPWSAIRDSSVAVEMEWMVGPLDRFERRYARMWIAPAGSANCVAALAELEKDRESKKRCIAAKEISAISTKFALLDAPFIESVETTGGPRPRPTSKEWRWFGVEKHQHQLVRSGTPVARYVWYKKNLIPNSMFTSIETCPANAHGDLRGGGVRSFWKEVLSAR